MSTTAPRQQPGLFFEMRAADGARRQLKPCPAQSTCPVVRLARHCLSRRCLGRRWDLPSALPWACSRSGRRGGRNHPLSKTVFPLEHQAARAFFLLTF